MKKLKLRSAKRVLRNKLKLTRFEDLITSETNRSVPRIQKTKRMRRKMRTTMAWDLT